MKRLLASMLHHLGRATGWSLFCARRQKVGRILMFHGVGDDVYSTAHFARDLRFLSRHFEVVPLAEIVERLRQEQPLGRALALTFDDGLRNNLTEAYPVLRELKLPATFFVCPGLIEEQRWLWNHEARARLRSLSPGQRRELATSWSEDRDSAVEDIVAWMKTLHLSSRLEVEKHIREATPGFVPSESQRRKYDMMSWEELASLDPAWITIGSHTVTHPILPMLSRAQLAGEIVESQRWLEKRLGRPVRQFCYPNGAHDEDALELVSEHYAAAVTTEAGFVQEASALWSLPRLGIAPEPLLSWRLHRPTA